MSEGTWVGLDVHARSAWAGVLDAVTGELRTQRVSPRGDETVAWLQTLPQPVRVGYEAGPSGYGLARACAAAGIACTVAAPSKISRPAGDRVKTDRRDAERLARLLRLGDLVAVRVPAPHEEAARDLVRAREDTRGDLMRARQRLSKLLLRHGLVYDGRAWTREHDRWLHRQRFVSRPLALSFDEYYGAVLQAKARRDTLDQAIGELATEKGLEALREWAPKPTPFPRINHEGVTRLLAADLVGEAPVRESVSALRSEIADLSARLDEAEAVAETLPHRRKYLLLNLRLARRLLAAHLEWVDEVEKELAPPRRARDSARPRPELSSRKRRTGSGC
jgi:hypothetical protein